MKNYSFDPTQPIKSDLARLDQMKDEDIDYSDIPELGDEFFSRAVHPPPDPRTGADLIAAMQASPYREIDIEPPKAGAMSSLSDLPPPPLFGEDWLSAQLLEIVCRHCGTTGDELDSHGDPLRAELMRLCAESGDIEITAEFGDRITGTITPEGLAMLARLDD